MKSRSFLAIAASRPKSAFAVSGLKANRVSVAPKKEVISLKSIYRMPIGFKDLFSSFGKRSK